MVIVVVPEWLIYYFTVCNENKYVVMVINLLPWFLLPWWQFLWVELDNKHAEVDLVSHTEWIKHTIHCCHAPALVLHCHLVVPNITTALAPGEGKINCPGVIVRPSICHLFVTYHPSEVAPLPTVSEPKSGKDTDQQGGGELFIRRWQDKQLYVTAFLNNLTLHTAAPVHSSVTAQLFHTDG